MKYLEWMSPEWVQVLFVLFLSFLIGLEREERKDNEGHYSFGGVRTFPLIGLIGYSMGLLSGGELLPQALGFAVVAGFLMISYWHKLTTSTYSGVASEMSGLTTYLVGSLIYHQMFWIATTLTVSSIILLELKAGLESLAKRIQTTDILTFAKFLLLSSVILPLLPDTPFSQFQINLFKTWLVVVAVSAVSYGSYVLQRLTKGQGGFILAAFLGGAYSSTVATVALARRSKSENQPHLFSGGILIASGMMYLRLAVLLALFNQELMAKLSIPFVGLGGLPLVSAGCGQSGGMRTI
ncbi:MgtC/SapB family protein [Sideroxydans sp. CL21]|uniref:MgtC/SapB family protein n=1 Tax=Sideroxydans sp. CL21 TaxID=2600596 RepID=UPI0024BD5952|nr:MgtC/SapB family protein [Sideroxydans sp. CL21]